MISVSVNDEKHELAPGTVLAELLEQQPASGAFAVAINGEFVPRSQYAARALADGDQIDVVSPVGGG